MNMMLLSLANTFSFSFSSLQSSLPFPPRPRSSLYFSHSPNSLPSNNILTESRLCANSTWTWGAESASESEGSSSWEEPDDGSDSDYEEQDEGSTYEEDLLRELEQLLTPEEKAIFDMNKNPDLNKISTPKWNPLHTFALAMQIPQMDKLLESDMDINSVDKDGVTPLHRAVMGKKEAVISHLLRKSANPHVRDRDDATPLHYAVQVGALQTVKLLIKYQVDVNVADNEDWTPLHLAIQGRNRDIAKVLLMNGADSTRRNKDGKTPLDLSLCYGKDFKSYDLARLLKLVPANRDP